MPVQPEWGKHRHTWERLGDVLFQTRQEGTLSGATWESTGNIRMSDHCIPRIPQIWKARVYVCLQAYSMSCGQRSGALTKALSPWAGYRLLHKLIPCGRNLLRLIHTKFSLKSGSDWKIWRPACVCIKNPNRSLFTLLFHFPSNQALAGNNPQRADYTGKIQQLSDHTSSPGKALHQGKSSVFAAEQNGIFSTGLPGIDGSHVLSRAELKARTTEWGLVRRSLTRFLSKIKKLVLIASRLFQNMCLLLRSWEQASRCFGVSKAWYTLLLICMFSVPGEESFLQE